MLTLVALVLAVSIRRWVIGLRAGPKQEGA
jgi:hypothetical protein